MSRRAIYGRLAGSYVSRRAILKNQPAHLWVGRAIYSALFRQSGSERVKDDFKQSSKDEFKVGVCEYSSLEVFSSRVVETRLDSSFYKKLEIPSRVLNITLNIKQAKSVLKTRLIRI
jgi:hypothetical protein